MKQDGVFFDGKNYYNSAFEIIKPSRYVDIVALDESALIYVEIHISVAMLSLPLNEIKHFMFSYAFEKGLLPNAYSLYAHNFSLYFTVREHFDEQKRVCECYFFDTTLVRFKDTIITNEIFLPMVLFALNDDLSAFVSRVKSHLYYFTRDGLKERRTLASGHYQGLDSTLSYFQASYNTDIQYVYSFDEHKDLHTRYIGELCPRTQHLDKASLKAFLAFNFLRFYNDLIITSLSESGTESHITQQTNVKNITLSSLPNFAIPKSKYKWLLPFVACACVLFMFFVPLGIMLHSQYLQSEIDELNAKTQSLFIAQSPSDEDKEHSQMQKDALKELSLLQQRNDIFIAHTHDILAWQTSYESRYTFMNDIFTQCHSPDIVLERVTFAFTPQMFVASLEVNAQSQIILSSLLAGLNTKKTKAILQKSSHKDSVFYSHILVIYNV